MTKIQKVVDKLKERGEDSEYISNYLQNIIEGIEKISPKVVNDYMEVTLFNQR